MGNKFYNSSNGKNLSEKEIKDYRKKVNNKDWLNERINEISLVMADKLYNDIKLK